MRLDIVKLVGKAPHNRRRHYTFKMEEAQAKKKFSASLKRGISSIGKLSLAREAILVRSSRKDVKVYTKRVVEAILFCQKAGMSSTEIEEIMFDREQSTIEDSKGDQSE